MKATKKQSLVELALSLGFTKADENDPIYSDGWIAITSVDQEFERLTKLEQINKETDE
jgi:hypothetical protein